MNAFITAIIPYIIGGGGVALVGAVVKGWSSLRAGAQSLEREAVANLARMRREAEDELKLVQRDRDYWQLVQARYAAQLLRAGIEPVPADPRPPSEGRHGE